MNLKKLILTIAGVGAMGGCCHLGNYVRPDIQVDTSGQRIKVYDSNKDSKWDSVTVYLKGKGTTYIACDSDFNGTWERLCSISRYPVGVTDETGQQRFLAVGTAQTKYFDDNNDGKYERFEQTMRSRFGRDRDITLTDINGDGIFDKFMDNLHGIKLNINLSLDEQIQEHLDVIKKGLEYIKK